MTYPYDPQNVFAKILRGEIPCKKVYENDVALVFEDIHPQAPLHLLVIPKKPYNGFSHFMSQASQEEILGFFQAIEAVATQFSIHESGYRLVTNNGPHSGQEVPHLHFHLLAKKKMEPHFS